MNLTNSNIAVSEREQISHWQIEHLSIFELVYGKFGRSVIDLVSKLDIL